MQDVANGAGRPKTDEAQNGLMGMRLGEGREKDGVP